MKTRTIELAICVALVLGICAVFAAGDRRLVPIAVGLYVALVLTAVVARRLFERPDL